jgi:hypothetical protein
MNPYVTGVVAGTMGSTGMNDAIDRMRSKFGKGVWDHLDQRWNSPDAKDEYTATRRRPSDACSCSAGASPGSMRDTRMTPRDTTCFVLAPSSRCAPPPSAIRLLECDESARLERLGTSDIVVTRNIFCMHTSVEPRPSSDPLHLALDVVHIR